VEEGRSGYDIYSSAGAGTRKNGKNLEWSTEKNYFFKECKALVKLFNFL